MELIIDGDIYLYKIATACVNEVQFGDEIYSSVNETEMRDDFDKFIDTLIDDMTGSFRKLKVIAFSCPSSEGFRKKLYPEYKANRVQKKPLGFKKLKEYVKKTYPTLEIPQLEGDDVLGILATQPDTDYTIVSIDKDFLTIPGNMILQDQPFKQTPEGAVYNHYLQTLEGDRTDNYPGCPGIGKVKAAKLLKENGVKWSTVVGAFEKAGLTEEDALVNARCARILQYSDYNFQTKEPILWTPPKE